MNINFTILTFVQFILNIPYQLEVIRTLSKIYKILEYQTEIELTTT